MTYHDLCRENRYLFGQLEKITLLEGHAIVFDRQNDYKAYQRTKVSIRRQIDINLDKIEAIWHADTLTEQIEVVTPTRIRINRIKFNSITV